MSNSLETVSPEAAAALPEVPEALVKQALSRGKIPKLQRGDSYTINALMGVAGWVLAKNKLSSADSERMPLVIAVADALKQRGVELRAAVGEMNDFRNSETTTGKRTAYLSEWRDRPRDLRTIFDGIEQEVIDRFTQVMIGRAGTHPWTDSGLNIAVGRQLSKESNVSRSRVDALRLAIVGRVMESVDKDPSVWTPDGSAEGQPDDAVLHTDGDLLDGADEDYADSDPDADLAELKQKGIDPTQPSKAKPGSEEKVLQLAARYAAGHDFFRPEDENDQTSVTDEEAQRRARVAASTAAADRVRADLAALKEY